MYHFFISYSREDVEAARQVEKRLREHGFEARIDVDSLRAGDQWQDRLDRQIRESVALILVLSPSSAQSVYVSYEWAFALGVGVKMLPLLFEETADIHPRLESIHRLDFTNKSNRPWRALIDELELAREAYSPQTIYLPRDTPVVIRQAAAALDSMDAQKRQTALENLGRMSKHDAAHETLARAVNHPFDDVRALAAVNLAAKGDIVAFPGLIEALQTDQVPVGATQFAMLGAPAAMRLVSALTDANARVRECAAASLAKLRYFESRPALVDALRDDDDDVRAAVAAALGEVGDSSCVQPLLGALGDSDERVRAAVVKALGQIGDGAAVVESLMHVHRTNEDQRDSTSSIQIIDALGEIGGPDAVAALIECLDSRHDQVPHNAAKALGRIGLPNAIPALVTALQEQPSLTRRSAFDALVAIGDASVGALVELLEDPESAVRLLSAQALGEINSDGAIAALVGCLTNDDRTLADSARNALRQFPVSRVIDPIAKLLQQETGSDVRKMLEEVLYDLGDPDTRKTMRQLMRAERIDKGRL